MSLDTNLGRGRTYLEESEANARLSHVNSPLMTGEELEQLRRSGERGFHAVTVSVLVEPAEGAEGMDAGLERVCLAAEQAIDDGATIVILSDRALDGRGAVVRNARIGVDLVFTIIETNERTMDELGLPEHLKLLTRYQNGLILVTGSVGSGKSTTLTALVEQVNIERREHIITLEDPIEYRHEDHDGGVGQRGCGTDAASFAAALRGGLGQTPAGLRIGERRRQTTTACP